MTTPDIPTTLSILKSGNYPLESSTMNGEDKKVRKKRMKKVSKLENLGWDTTLSWSLPRFKRFMSDPQRKVCSIQNALYFSTNSDSEDESKPVSGSDGWGGAIITVERGPRIEQILIVTEFVANWINHPEFQKLIGPFTSTSKSSRFVLISSEAKSWGKSKVEQGKKMFNEAIEVIATNEIPTRIVDVSPIVPESRECVKLNIKPKKMPLKINTDVPKVENEVESPNSNDNDSIILKSILVNFSENIKKVTGAFANLQKSLNGLTGVSEQIDNFINKN